jgi:hypothetical protein
MVTNGLGTSRTGERVGIQSESFRVRQKNAFLPVVTPRLSKLNARRRAALFGGFSFFGER